MVYRVAALGSTAVNLARSGVNIAQNVVNKTVAIASVCFWALLNTVVAVKNWVMGRHVEQLPLAEGGLQQLALFPELDKEEPFYTAVGLNQTNIVAQLVRDAPRMEIILANKSGSLTKRCATYDEIASFSTVNDLPKDERLQLFCFLQQGVFSPALIQCQTQIRISKNKPSLAITMPSSSASGQVTTSLKVTVDKGIRKVEATHIGALCYVPEGEEEVKKNERVTIRIVVDLLAKRYFCGYTI